VLPKAELEAIESFLDLLQHDARGRAIAVNILDSYTELLLSAAALREFLLDCAETMSVAVDPARTPEKIVDRVSRGRGVRRGAYLRHCRQTGFDDAERLSTTMNVTSFWRYFLSDQYKDPAGFPVTLPARPLPSPSGEREYADRLSSIVSNPDWFETTATLGRPLPEASNCWITTDRFGADPSPLPYASDLGTEARDELGLIGEIDGSYLLRFTFRASELGKLPACEVARPSAADLGNSRFCARQTSSRAVEFGARGWGATVHLGKFENASRDVTGRSERVTESLPLRTITVTVDYLGRTNGSRGISAKRDDDEAFAQLLEAARSPLQIREAILAALH
jgi:hypothetical protein